MFRAIFCWFDVKNSTKIGRAIVHTEAAEKNLIETKKRLRWTKQPPQSTV